MWYYLLFFFVTVGAKLLLAVAMIFMLLPAERRCSGCDGDTLLLAGGPFGRLARRLSLGVLERRWCPRCGWEGFSRRGTPYRPDTDVAAKPTSTTRS